MNETAAPNNFVFPDAAWQRSTPAAQGFDPAKVAAVGALMREKKANGVLVRNGYLVGEWYHGGTAETQFDIQSCTKTVTSLALGFALHEGRIPAIDTPVKQLWPGFAAGPYTDQITFEHLVTMTAGITQDQTYGTGQAIEQASEYAPPGTRCIYLNDQTKLLGAALTYIYGQRLVDFMNPRLAAMNIRVNWGSEARWDPDVTLADGTRIAVNCAYARVHTTANELARIGHLYLANGMWNGKELLSPEYVRHSLTSTPSYEYKPQRGAVDSPEVYGYGYSWRKHECNGVTYWAMNGYGQQFCVIVPDYNIVLVKINDWRDKSTWLHHHRFLPLLLDGLQQ